MCQARRRRKFHLGTGPKLLWMGELSLNQGPGPRVLGKVE